MKVLANNKNLAVAALWGATKALTVFWIVNILKEAYKPVKDVLGFYSPVGPLLGLFLVSLAVFVVVTYVLAKSTNLTQKLSEKTTFWAYAGSVALFFVMVFPPVFEPIVNVLAGK